MVKKLFRSLLIGILVFALALAAGCLSFVLTYRYQTEKHKEAPSTVSARQVYQPALPTCTYLARLENGAIAIYACFDNREEFLYSLDVPVAELPAVDLTKLQNGITLSTKEALTAFEEDYTS